MTKEYASSIVRRWPLSSWTPIWYARLFWRCWFSVCVDEREWHISEHGRRITLSACFSYPKRIRAGCSGNRLRSRIRRIREPRCTENNIVLESRCYFSPTEPHNRTETRLIQSITGSSPISPRDTQSTYLFAMTPFFLSVFPGLHSFLVLFRLMVEVVVC